MAALSLALDGINAWGSGSVAGHHDDDGLRSPLPKG